MLRPDIPSCRRVIVRCLPDENGAGGEPFVVPLEGSRVEGGPAEGGQMKLMKLCQMKLDETLFIVLLSRNIEFHTPY